MQQTDRAYPRVLSEESAGVSVRMMVPEDAPAILAFARDLPRHDLLFLPRDIGQPKVVEAWMREIARGAMASLVALDGEAIVGCATIACDPLSWSPHVGELRVVIAQEARGKGLGRALTQEIFALALSLGLEKMTAQMTVDQKGAIAVFEGIGFRPEGLLREHVRGPGGTKQDIVILGHDVGQVQARLRALGMPEAV